jgi:hypothetical protein
VSESQRVHALPAQGYGRSISVAAYVKPDGVPGLFGTAGFAKGRIGSGAYHGVEVWTTGPAGGITPGVVLSPKDCRALAEALILEAARLEFAERTARP